MDERGNSFLELLVVMAILGVIATVAVSLFRLQEKTELELEAACLVSEIRYAQELSHTVQPLHAAFPMVEAEDTPKFVVQSHDYYILHNGKMHHRHTLPVSIRLMSNRSRFYFAPDGTAQTVTIIMIQGNVRRYVIVDIAGRVRVSDTPPD